MMLPGDAVAWNNSGHMLSGSLAYQILSAESPATVAAVKAILEKHPWFYNRWKTKLEKHPRVDPNEMLFMLVPSWADEIRRTKEDRQQWHYINFPFKPDGQPVNVNTKAPAAINILTALRENARVAKSDTDPISRAIALAWLFHLIGDLHQPLHTIQLFTTDYTNGDRGGNLICVRTKATILPITMHQFWDEVLTSSQSPTILRNFAAELRGRPEFARNNLAELGLNDFESWASESYDIAVKIAYQNGKSIGLPKGKRQECSKEAEAPVLMAGYPLTANRISTRRMVLAGYRLADLLRNGAVN